MAQRGLERSREPRVARNRSGRSWNGPDEAWRSLEYTGVVFRVANVQKCSYDLRMRARSASRSLLNGVPLH
jgi:hypothetical protein